MKSLPHPILSAMCLVLLSLCASSSATAGEPTTKDPEPAKMLVEIKRFLPPVVLVPWQKMNIEGLSGHYEHPVASDRASATDGFDLYLFPDRTYIYVEWADILSPTIFEKGNWNVTNGFVVIERDNSMTNRWDIADHAYLPYSLTNSVEIQVFLMGREKSYSHYLDSSFPLSDSLERVSRIKNTDLKPLKDKLMKESWRPEFYK